MSQSLAKALDASQCISHQISSEFELWEILKHESYPIDCCIFENSPTLSTLLDELKNQYIFLPTIVVVRDKKDRHSESEQLHQWSGVSEELSPAQDSEDTLLNYHPAMVYVESGEIHDIEDHIHHAIEQFVALPKGGSSLETLVLREPDGKNTFTLHKKRLLEKLRERLGYLGIYYKRNPGNFLRNMSQVNQQIFLRKLRQDYRTIILNYFSDDQNINQKIDTYVDAAFFADVSVSQIVEIHMDLMDEFSRQLQLEGRGDEILLDYRLTLIDVIAHLCEMYRRSIPRDTIKSSN